MSKTRPTDYVAVELYLVLDLTSTVVLFTDLATQTIPNLPGFRKRTTKARDFVMAFKSFNSEIRRLETQFNCREKQLTDLSLRQSEHMQLPIPLFVPLLDALLKDTKTTMRNFENWVDNLQKCYETEDATGQGWLERLENLRRQWNPTIQELLETIPLSERRIYLKTRGEDDPYSEIWLKELPETPNYQKESEIHEKDPSDKQHGKQYGQLYQDRRLYPLPLGDPESNSPVLHKDISQTCYGTRNAHWILSTGYALIAIMCAISMRNYDQQHTPGQPSTSESSATKSVLSRSSSAISSPSPGIFVMACLAHGIATLLYYQSRPGDLYQEWFLAVGIIGGSLTAFFGMRTQGVLIGVLPLSLIASLVLCTIMNCFLGPRCSGRH